MAKKQNDLMLDAALDYVITNGTEYYLCSSEPADRAAALTAALTGNMGTSFSAKANGDTNGRKVTVQAETGQAVTADGTATHLALCSASALIYVTTCPSQGVSNGGTVDVAAWDIEVADVA